MTAQGMNEQDFEGRFQALLLLGGESESSSQFTAGLRAILNETQEAVDMAMTPEEIEAIGFFLLFLRQIMENQEKFLLDLRAQTLAQLIPDQTPGEEVTN